MYPDLVSFPVLSQITMLHPGFAHKEQRPLESLGCPGARGPDLREVRLYLKRVFPF
jgi:hypothetical protein